MDILTESDKKHHQVVNSLVSENQDLKNQMQDLMTANRLMNQQLARYSKQVLEPELFVKFKTLQSHAAELQLELNDTQSQLSTLKRTSKANMAPQNNGPSLEKPLQMPSTFPSPEIFHHFVAADKENTGKLDASQLLYAINKGPWPPLSKETAFNLLRLVSQSRDFCFLNGFPVIWYWIITCKQVFEIHDKARKSPRIWGYVNVDSPLQLGLILNDVGLNLHSKAIGFIFQKMVSRSRNSWDDFVSLVTVVKAWDIEFRILDQDGDKSITIPYQIYMINIARCIL